MSKPKVIARIITLLADYQCTAEANFRPETKLREDVGLDSLDLMELVFRSETEFNVTLDKDEVAHCSTVDQFASWVHAKINP
jgi:acyl carrier protein